MRRSGPSRSEQHERHPARRTAEVPTSTRRTDRTTLVVFFALAYGLSWTVWGSTLARSAGLLDRSVPAEPFGFLAVSVAAVIATVASGGRRALRSLGSRLVLWRVAPRWYVAAVALPVLPALAALGVHLALGGEHDLHAFVPLTATLPLLLSQLVTHLLTEEAGWRGVALPRLRASLARCPPGWSWVCCGPAGTSRCSSWRAPARPTRSRASLVMVVSISVVMTWVWDHTRGSVLIAALFHATMNTGWAVLNVLWADARLFWLCVAFTAVLAAVVAVRQLRAAGPASVRRRAVDVDDGAVPAS